MLRRSLESALAPWASLMFRVWLAQPRPAVQPGNRGRFDTAAVVERDGRVSLPVERVDRPGEGVGVGAVDVVGSSGLGVLALLGLFGPRVVGGEFKQDREWAVGAYGRVRETVVMTSFRPWWRRGCGGGRVGRWRVARSCAAAVLP
ncbi:hypothetical protein [Streptomyces sp. NPDC020298]|uniref:hypothetical protein n=1 Tax=unclassified Streptomyces TaxID=2593676 RepID=UPI00340CFD85